VGYLYGFCKWCLLHLAVFHVERFAVSKYTQYKNKQHVYKGPIHHLFWEMTSVQISTRSPQLKPHESLTGKLTRCNLRALLITCLTTAATCETLSALTSKSSSSWIYEVKRAIFVVTTVQLCITTYNNVGISEFFDFVACSSNHWWPSMGASSYHISQPATYEVTNSRHPPGCGSKIKLHVMLGKGTKPSSFHCRFIHCIQPCL